MCSEPEPGVLTTYCSFLCAVVLCTCISLFMANKMMTMTIPHVCSGSHLFSPFLRTAPWLQRLNVSTTERTILYNLYYKKTKWLACFCQLLGLDFSRTMHLPDITKQSIFIGEMYLMICVEWADDHFGLCLTSIDPLLMKICTKNDFYIFVPSDLALWLLDLKFLLPIYCCPAPCFHLIRSFYSFPFWRKSERTDG